MPHPPCERLYRADSLLTRFSAHVTSAAAGPQGAALIELDRTAFYPTGGGQPFDTGSLGGLAVMDVREQEDGRIVHVVRADAESMPVAGSVVEGVVDRARRFDHMQQHSGQHILSRACQAAASAATRSFHLGDRVCTIDVDLPEPDGALLRRAEALANEVIAANVPVTVTERPVSGAARIPGEAGGRDLALKPGDPLRLVSVGDFDETPCGGTHVAASGQVGSVLVRSWERFKGGTRITFVCGGRVVAEAARLASVADRCAARLSVPPDEIEEAVSRLQDLVAALKRQMKGLSENVAELEREALERSAREAGGWRVLSALLDQRAPEDLQRLAQRCAAAPGRVALLAGTSRDGAVSLVFARSPEGPAPAPSMGDLLSSVCAAFGGRGGGGAALARGGGMAAERAMPALEAAFNRLREQIAS